VFNCGHQQSIKEIQFISFLVYCGHLLSISKKHLFKNDMPAWWGKTVLSSPMNVTVFWSKVRGKRGIRWHTNKIYYM